MTWLQNVAGVASAGQATQANMEVIDAMLVRVIAGRIWVECPEKGSKYLLVMRCIDPAAADSASNVTVDWQGPYALTDL